MSSFDPYRKWLSIPEDFRPPTHYQLLGVSPDERDLEVIDAAVLRQSAYVRNFQTGKYAADATRILNEISAAKLCLLDPAKRAAYDAELKRKGLFPQPAHETPVAPLIAEPRPRAARPAPQAPVSQPVAPSIDLDALANAARMPSRSRRSGPQVRLASRPRQASIPTSYWVIGLAIAFLAVAFIIGISIVKSLNAPGASEPNLTAEGADGGALNDLMQSSERPSPANTGSNANAKGVSPPVGGLPGGDEPSPLPEMPANGLPAAGPEKLTESEADSGSPSVYPGEIDLGEPTVSIPLPPSEPLIVFAPAPSSLVAVGQTVYDATTGAVSGTTGAFQATARDALRALSPDGKYYAAAKPTGTSGIEVRSCETGEFLYTLNFDRSFLRLKLLAFSQSDRLVSAARFGAGQRVQIWDLESGKLLKEVLTEEFEQHQAALNHNASALAIATTNDGIIVYDLRGSRDQQPAEQLLQIPIAPGAGGAVAIDGLAFSPAGDELLAVLDGGARILCWNEGGELVFEHLSGVDLRAVWTGACVYQGPTIEWHPAGRGWLLGGHFFFERALRRVSWMLQTDRDEEAHMRFLGVDRLILLRGKGHERNLADIAIPWEQINASLRAMESDQPRHLGSGAAAGLQVRVGRVLPGASHDEVRRAIEFIVGKRLEEEKVSLAVRQPTQLVVNYFEERKQQGGSHKSPLNQGDLKLQITLNNGARDVFTANLVAEAEGEGEEMRQYLYWRLANRLRQTPIPYFIPKSGKLVSLPAVLKP